MATNTFHENLRFNRKINLFRSVISVYHTEALMLEYYTVLKYGLDVSHFKQQEMVIVHC